MLRPTASLQRVEIAVVRSDIGGAKVLRNAVMTPAGSTHAGSMIKVIVLAIQIDAGRR